jgi:2'-5' RNA ligase
MLRSYAMRLFTGIDLSADVRQRLERQLAQLRPAAHLKWSPVDNLHITTKFIGEWPENKLDDLTAALGSIASRPPITIAIEGLGWFPNPHQPRVFWAGAHGGQPLSELAGTIDQALHPIGIPLETKPYSPHVTLARIAQPTSLTAIQHAIAGLESAEFGMFQAKHFYLYLSHAGPAGTIYTKLSEFAISE